MIRDDTFTRIRSALARGPMTAQQIGRRFGYAPECGFLQDTLREMEAEGLIARTGYLYRGCAGRPPIVWELNESRAA